LTFVGAHHDRHLNYFKLSTPQNKKNEDLNFWTA